MNARLPMAARLAVAAVAIPALALLAGVPWLGLAPVAAAPSARPGADDRDRQTLTAIENAWLGACDAAVLERILAP